MEAATSQSVPLEDIKQKLKNKMCQNYHIAFVPNVDINNEVEKFLLDPLRCHDSEICGVFLLALGSSECKNLSSKFKRMLNY